MKLIGLTGGIGAGKSTVSAMLVKRGARLVDADQITRSVQQAGSPVFLAMVERFGPGIVGEDGSLDRAAVAEIVFSDPAALADLNAIVHPAVGAEVAAQIGAFTDTNEIVVLDIPLLVEGKTPMPYVGVLVVDAPIDVVLDRLVRFRGMSAADAEARIANQASREERLERADWVIDNRGSADALEGQVDAAYEWMTGLTPLDA